MFGNAEANREARACKSLAPVRKKKKKNLNLQGIGNYLDSLLSDPLIHYSINLFI